MRSFVAAPLALLAGLIATSASAAPEQLDQLEPGKGTWQAEYHSTFDRGDESERSLEAMFGLGRRVAVGIELEAERSDGRMAVEAVAGKLLYRLTPDGSKVGAGLQLQLAVDGQAVMTEAELRFIVETRKRGWWGQANLMLRRSAESGNAELNGAYAWSVQRSIAGVGWLGIEGSGQRPLSCGSTGCGESGHSAGPSLTTELELGRTREAEIGFALLHRLSGRGPRTNPRFFVQISF
ncbi:MAG TPA: hypothetical protein VE053_03910 [Allosphingosinicella sp.]|nr:hypothetical protein [Allosphingosinicella sp.]